MLLYKGLLIGYQIIKAIQMLYFYLDISIILEWEWTKIVKRHLIPLLVFQNNTYWHNFILQHVIILETELIKTWIKQFIGMKNLLNMGAEMLNIILLSHIKLEMMSTKI